MTIMALSGVGKVYPRRDVEALRDISLALVPGRVLGVVGGSGSGKSTLANILVGLERPTEGAVTFQGRDVAALRGDDFRTFRRNVQMVFQDPFATLSPRFTVGRSVEEPLVIHRLGDRAERRVRAIAALEAAELRPGEAFLGRFPHELSGGQRQRVAIARAVVLEPAVLIADEPVSMLDVSVRAGILAVLKKLVAERNMAMMFITHDLSIVPAICDDLAVVLKGRLIESGPAAEVLGDPRHPYTRALSAAVPRLRKAGSEAPSAIEAPAREVSARACVYAARCRRAVERCFAEAPSLKTVSAERQTACFCTEASESSSA